MNEKDFKSYLKKKRKSSHVIKRHITGIKNFNNFLKTERNKDLSSVTKEDISSYVEYMEKANHSAKGPLYVLSNYFRFIDDEMLFNYATSLRAKRTKASRRIFPIKEFLDIDPLYIKKLSEVGIKNVEQMLEKGKTKQQRKDLSKKLDIPESKLLELVQLSDLTRIGYVKKKLTRLYHNAGLTSPAKVAQFNAEELYEYFKQYVEESGWDGMVPNLKDLKNNIASAKKLKEVVEV